MKSMTLPLIAMLSMLLSTPLTHAGTPDKTVTLSFTPLEIEIEDGIIARVARGNEERVEIYCDEPSEIICKKDSRSGSLELKRKSRQITSFFQDLRKLKCIAIIVTKDPSAIREISCDSGASIKMDDEGLRFSSLSLSADSGGEILIKGDCPRMNIEADSGGRISVSGVFGRLEAEADSGARVTIQGNIERGSFSVDSGASISAKGRAGFADVECDSSGVFDGKGLIADAAALEADSGGVIRITCTGDYKSEKDSGGVIEVSRPK